MRAKLWTLAGIALTGALSLIAGAQPWVSFMLDGTHTVEVSTGHELNAALSPVAIALVAAALALTIAGKVFRRVLGALVALIAVGLVALTWTILASPLAAVSGKITELTGLVGGSGEIVAWSQVSPWAYTSLVAGLVAVLLGVIVVVLGSGWGAAGRKYDSERGTRAREQSTPDRISDWDSLSDGDDPSREDPSSDEPSGEDQSGEKIR